MSPVKIPNLRQINTEDYKLNKIQDYTNIMSKETNRYVDSQRTRLTVLSNSSSVTLPISVASVNAYLTYTTIVYDPYNGYDTQSGVYKSPADAWFEICLTNTLITTPGTLVSLYGQINKSGIDPIMTEITNFEVHFDSRIANAAGLVMLNGVYFLNLGQNDTVQFVIYATSVNPIVTLSQAVFKW